LQILKRLSILAIITVLASLFSVAGPAFAQGEDTPTPPPSVFPAAYYGSVKNTKGEAVAAGIVKAYIEEQECGELAFTDGFYGGEDPTQAQELIVQGSSEILGKPVTFVVVVSNQSYPAQSSPATMIMEEGDIKKVDLTIDYSAPPPTLPAIASTDPAINATGVPLDKTISITFSKSIQAGPAYYNITLVDIQNISIGMTKSINGTLLTLDPSTNLSPKTTYTVNLPIGAVKDSDGNPNAFYTFKFTTGESIAGPQPPQQPQPPGPISFTDLSGHWAKDTVLQLVYLGIIKGYPDNTFRPDNKITRAEVTVILTRALKLSPGDETELVNFSDQDAIPAWARGSVAAAVYAGLIKGYPEEGGFTFKPNNPITRAELATLTARVIVQKTGSAQAPESAFADASTIPDWAKEGINLAAAKGIITGYPDKTFQPAKEITRAETAAMILRLLNLLSGK